METVFEMSSSIGMVLRVYEDRIVLTQKGVMGALTRGFSGEKTIYIRDITSVQFKEAAWTAGFIEFTFPGSNDRPGGSIFGVPNENRFTFSNRSMSVQKELTAQAQKIKEFIDRKIGENKSQSRSQIISVADELAKFKKLLDDGVLTEAEFAKKKQELLGL